MKEPKQYIIPWKPHGKRAKTKAEVNMSMIDGRYTPDARRPPMTVIVAATVKDAKEQSQKLILPKDSRPLIGLSNIHLCEATTMQAAGVLRKWL